MEENKKLLCAKSVNLQIDIPRSMLIKRLARDRKR